MGQVTYTNEIPAFLEPYMASREMQRLKKIDMNCGMNYTSVPLFKNILPYSRYDHSLNVALIVYQHTKDRAQSLSGLFHDISTPAFSHVVDFLHGDALKQESTEDLTRKIIADSPEIMAQLKQDGILLDQVADYHLYPIADNDSPKLSSDRLEYTFGAAIDYGFGTAEEFQPLYDDICPGINESGETELVFEHTEQAEQFALLALCNGLVFTSKEDRCCMEQLARILHQAIEQNILSEDDLYRNEEWVIQKLEQSPLEDAWQQFQHISRVVTSSMPEEGWINIQAKKRYIDPYCLQEKCRVSQFSAVFQQQIAEFLADPQQEWMKGVQ